MPEAFLLAPVAEAAIGAGSIDAIVTGSFVSAAGLGGTSIFGTIGASFLGRAALSIGASLALNYVGSLFANRSQPVSRSDITIRQPTPARFIDVGRVKTGGAVFLYESPDQYFFVGKVLTCARIQEIESINFNDTVATFDGPITTSTIRTSLNGPWTLNISIDTKIGTADQPISALLAAHFDEVVWPSDNRLAGLPLLVTRYRQVAMEDFPSRYPNGAPEATAVIKAAWCPDPRNPAHDLYDPETWSWTDNAACVILRFLIDVDGWGLSPDDIDLTDLVQAANDSDEGVATTAGIEPRYRLSGRYTTTRDRAQTLKSMLDCCAGHLIEGPDGKAHLFVGVERTPTVMLTADDFKSIHIEPYGDPLDRAGIAQPRCVLEAYNWQEQPLPQVELAGFDPSAAAQIEDMPLEYCRSEFQGQRLGKIRLHRLSPEWTVSGVAHLSGLRAFLSPMVRLVHDELGIDQTFEVLGYGLNLNDFTVPLKLQSVTPGMFDMTATELKDMPPPPSPPSYAGMQPPADIVAVYAEADDTTALVTWTQGPFRPLLQVRGSVDDGWSEWVDVPVTEDGTATIADLTSGTNYQVRMMNKGQRSESPWSAPIDISEPE